MIHRKFIYLFLIFSSIIYGQKENYLDAILKLENAISKEQFLDTILQIEYDKALINAEKYLILSKKALEIAKTTNNKKLLAKAYISKSLAYHFSSKTALTIFNTLKAGEIYKELNDIENHANTYLNLGWQIKNRNLEKSVFYMQKGITILEKKSPLSFKLIFGYNNYGVLKQLEKQLDSALFYHKKSLQLSVSLNDSIGIPFAQTHIAEVFLKKKSFIKAEHFLKKALKIRKKRNDIYGVTDSYLYLGDLHYAKKEYKKAIHYFNLGEELSSKNSYFPLKKYAIKYLSKSYENTNNTKKAFNYYKKYTKLKDSILNKETNSKIAELEVRFNTLEKEKEISHQKEQLLKQKLILKNRNLYVIILISCFLILGILSFGHYHRNRFKRKQLQKEIDLKDSLATIKTQNRLQEQRLRISRDLHDNIGSQLTFIISSIDNLKYISKDTNSNLKKKLSIISSFTSETIHQLRDTIWAMNRSEISIEDLHARILSFIEKAKSATENIEFEINQDIHKKLSLSSLKGMNLFRVVQETINNSIKYAEASKIKITLSEKNDRVLISIVDNGIGFDIHKVTLGNGLTNMAKRMKEIYGTIQINSKINNGTEIKIIL
jgi:signal transduction histidine kinase